MTTIKRKPDFKKDHFEQETWQKELLLMGIDEVGRGCLAGPVVTAAVILHPHKKSRLLKDSKLLTQEELLKGYNWIIKNSWYSIGIINYRVIDKINIYQATLRCMKRAALQLLTTAPLKPVLIVVDAMPLVIDTFDGDIIHFIYGERKSSSIAAASIVAKVTRDALMRRFDPLFPGYKLASHKGYSTPHHKKILSELGPSIMHRTSYIDHFLELPDDETFQASFLAEQLELVEKHD